MKRRIAWSISLILGAWMAGMALAVVLFMMVKIQDAIASGRSMQMVFEEILALARFVVILGTSVLVLWGIVEITNRRIAWLYVSAFVGLIVWVIYDEIRDAIAEGRLMPMLRGWAFMLIGGLGGAMVILAVFGGIDTLRERIRKRQYRLPEGVTKEMVLRESPYELTYFQGESDYRVVDRRTGEFVDWKDPEGAEGWIIRQYLQQRRNERRKMRSAASSRNPKEGDLL